MINAVVYAAHGNPAEVLRLERQSWPEPGRDQVIVRMHAAPINPADLNQIEGKYPIPASLPATPGFEGAGIVAEIGKDVREMQIGAHVLMPHNVGTWREACAVDARDLVVVPSEIDLLQAAMLKINPLTAWRLLHGYVILKPGEWVIQNAANSAAGRAVIQIARELGFKTVNVVRREELVEELRLLGGDIALVEGEDLRQRVKEATNGAPIALGLNAVGGESALRLMNCLSPGATLVTYGAMSLQPLKVPNGMLIFKDLRLRGIWINKWYDNASFPERMEALTPIFSLASRGLLRTQVEQVYPLMDAKAAVTHAAEAKRGGKIVFEF